VSATDRFRGVEIRVRDAYGIVARERWVDVAEPQVRVRVQEVGDGPAVIFVNGISAPGMGFAPLLPHLPGYRHLLLDLPGHGLAPPYLWRGRSLREQAVAILVGVLDGLDLQQATFVANSLGGMFTLWTALDAPARVSNAVIIGEPAVALPGARGNLSMALVTAPALGRFVQWGMRLPAPRFVTRAVMAGALGRPATKLISDDLLDLHTLSLQMPGQARSFRSLLRRNLKGRTARPENVLTADELARFTMPLLFVWGDQDVFLSPERGRVSVDAIPTARLETVPGGHDPWLDDPERCAALISTALATARSVNH
jgi:pimeloyl-ACP methyl ester carboxylesterase